jgi:AraC-like DNA-binding protein
MDVLSHVLKAISLNGAVFYNAEYSAPWSFRSPASSLLAPYVSGEPVHVMLYHLITEGSAWAQVETGPRVDLRPGDIVIFPKGDAHLMGNGKPVPPVDHARELERIASQGFKLARSGGGGDVTRFVCGYMCWDPQLSRILLDSLPPILRINVRDSAQGQWIEQSIRFSVAEAASGAGSDALIAKLSEALFIETLRRYISMLPPGESGWLGGLRDPEVGKALAAIHANPGKRWTVVGLANTAGVSRAVLAERFRHYLGEPPIAYLTRWRLQMGARLLNHTNQSVAEIADRVGYDSESAFNRVFKRHFGLPPAQYRKRARSEIG